MKKTIHPSSQADLSKGQEPLWKLRVPGSDGGLQLGDYGIDNINAQVDVVFRQPIQRLVGLIESHSAVVGCVAWLSNGQILRALASCSFVQIVVQKEDFLRPEANFSPRSYCRPLYEALRCSEASNTLGIDSEHIEYIAGMYGHQFNDAVRCVGNRANGLVKPSLMHNKFLVFGNLVDRDRADVFEPTTVWTGSLNLSTSSENNFENSVIIRSQTIAQQYVREWGQVYAISESLDWDSEWSDPEFHEANT